VKLHHSWALLSPLFVHRPAQTRMPLMPNYVNGPVLVERLGGWENGIPRRRSDVSVAVPCSFRGEKTAYETWMK